MIPDYRIKKYWPKVQKTARRYPPLDAMLLLALAWVASGLDPTATGLAGAHGLFLMRPYAAGLAARRLGVVSWNLHDLQTALDFAARLLVDQLECFVLPRTALAAFHAGPSAVARGAITPEDHRFARDVMAAWRWMREHLDGILSQPCIPTDSLWRMVAPRDHKSPVPIPDAALPVLDLLADRLGLAFYMDSERRRVFVGLPPAHPLPTPHRRPIICPVPGATRDHCGLYEGATALDILVPAGMPVVAAASGQVIQSRLDTGIWIALDEPFRYGKSQPQPLLHYANLSRLRFHFSEGSRNSPRVEQGDLIAWSGAGRVPHLAFGVTDHRRSPRHCDPLRLAACFGWLVGGERS